MRDRRMIASTVVVVMVGMVVVVGMAGGCLGLLPAYPEGEKVGVVATGRASGERLTRVADAEWGGRNGSMPSVVVAVNASSERQTLAGFGGAITDSVAYLWAKAEGAVQKELVEAFFSPEIGLNFTQVRLTIGSCDFSVGTYSYAETPDDWDLAHFSIAHDEEAIIPLVHAVMGVGGKDAMRFFACPWSPPGWMKRNGKMRNSKWPGLIQETRVFETYASYLSKYLSAYAAAGIPIYAISIQNEPHVAGQFLVTYECCGYSHADEASFLVSYLGPVLAREHPEVNIIVFDDQRVGNHNGLNMSDWVDAFMSASGVEAYADKLILGFHWYGGLGSLDDYEEIEVVASKYPGLRLHATEATLEAAWKQLGEDKVWQQAFLYAMDIGRDLAAGTEAYIHWNLWLDPEGGPEHSLGPCDAPILLHDSGPIKQLSYYVIGHFSKYLPVGSTMVDVDITTVSSSDGSNPPAEEGVVAVAAVPPGGEGIVVVVANLSPEYDTPTTVLLRDVEGDRELSLSIPGQSLRTLFFRRG